MAKTTYFTHGTRNEQFLLQNLVEEHLKMFGMDVLYCPREIMLKDGVFNEEVIGEFIYNEGKEKVAKLEEEMLSQYETPPLDMIG